MKISTNKFVSVDYELSIKNDETGQMELVEKTSADRPLNFIYGLGMMLPKFEEHLAGLQAGDKFEFSLDKADAYGDYIDENVIDLERSVFETDGHFDSKLIFEGNTIPLSDGEGNTFRAVVVKVTDKTVTVDLNHPFADETLYFKGSVLGVSEPSNEELAAMLGGESCSDSDCGGCSGCGGGCG